MTIVYESIHVNTWQSIQSVEAECCVFDQDWTLDLFMR